MYFNVYSLTPRRILKKKVWILLWNNASINMFYMKKTKKTKKNKTKLWDEIMFKP